MFSCYAEEVDACDSRAAGESSLPLSASLSVSASFSLGEGGGVRGVERREGGREEKREREGATRGRQRSRRKKKSQILFIAIPVSSSSFKPSPFARIARDSTSSIGKNLAHLKNAVLVATATKDSIALFFGGARTSAHVRDVALAPGESSTTEHELRCTRQAPGAIVLMNLEERKRLALLGREREREKERARYARRERARRERARKKKTRQRASTEKKEKRSNAQSNDFPGGERAINFGSAQGGDALALSLSLSLLPRPWRYARVSRGEISALAPRRFVPNGATQKLRKCANRKKKKKRAGSQKSRAPSSLSFLERASAPPSPHMRGIKKEDTVAVPRSERNGVTPAERAQKKRAIAFASSFPSAPHSRPSSLLSSGSRSLSGSPRALHSLFLIFSNFHLLALLFPFPFSPFSRFRHSHT